MDQSTDAAPARSTSEFFNTGVHNFRYYRAVVSQDYLGSRRSCEVKAQELLKEGARVIIDRYRALLLE